MFSALFFFVFGIITLLAIHDRVKYRRIHTFLEKFPGPINVPLIGIAHEFSSINLIVDKLLKYFHLYGSTYKVWIFRVPIVVISDPKHVEIVLNSENCLDKEKRYHFTKEVFGNGLFVAPAKIWKRNRTIINPTFNQKILDSFFDIFAKHGERMVERMELDIKENKFFDVDKFALTHTTNMIMETAMGIDDEETPKPPTFTEDLHRMAAIVVERMLKLWLYPDFIFRLSPSGREFNRLFRKLEGFLMKILEKRYSEYHSCEKKDELFFSGKRGKPFLEHLISIKKFTIQELLHEVAVILITGSDTVALTIGYVLVCLGSYKDIQDKVFEELREVFGESNRPICLDDLPKLQYLEKVIKETLRLYPVAALVARTVTKDIDIEDYIIPKDISVIVPIIAIHRNEKYWPDPNKFDPDRFLPSEVAKRHPYSFLPFSRGLRNCIGKQYGMMSMKILLSYILSVDLENVRFNVQVLVRILGGANISIEKRHK